MLHAHADDGIRSRTAPAVEEEAHGTWQRWAPGFSLESLTLRHARLAPPAIREAVAYHFENEGSDSGVEVAEEVSLSLRRTLDASTGVHSLNGGQNFA